MDSRYGQLSSWSERFLDERAIGWIKAHFRCFLKLKYDPETSDLAIHSCAFLSNFLLYNKLFSFHKLTGQFRSRPTTNKQYLVKDTFLKRQYCSFLNGPKYLKFSSYGKLPIYVKKINIFTPRNWDIATDKYSRNKQSFTHFLVHFDCSCLLAMQNIQLSQTQSRMPHNNEMHSIQNSTIGQRKINIHKSPAS